MGLRLGHARAIEGGAELLLTAAQGFLRPVRWPRSWRIITASATSKPATSRVTVISVPSVAVALDCDSFSRPRSSPISSSVIGSRIWSISLIRS